MYVRLSHVCAQKKDLGLLRLAFQTVVNHHVGAGNQIRLLGKTASAPSWGTISPGPVPWL